MDIILSMKQMQILKDIILEAGEIVNEGYQKNKKIIYKGVVDLVTQYDVETENFILDALEKEFPDYRLVGEESHKGSYEYDKAIYIDPIDGTTNFIHGIPHLAISVGVWEYNKPIMAVVYNPILDEMFWAMDGGGAYHNDKKMEVSAQVDLQQSLIATGFPYAKVDRGVEYRWVIDVMKNILPNIRDIRRLGAAALDLCYLADGKTDAFYEIDLKPWDVAAGILIVQEAGGEITNSSGNKYNLNEKSLVATNGKIHKDILRYLEPI